MSAQRQSNVEVAIRVRPMRPEIGETKTNWDVQRREISEKSNPDSRFTFDRIYDSDSRTQDLYENSVRDTIVKSVAKGYNGTVFAYGQTGSGKSFTMLGDGMGGKNEGIVTMAVKDLFAALEAEKAAAAAKQATSHTGVEISVFVAMLEIYNEQLRDLLAPPGSVTLPLSIRENEHGVYVHNSIRREIKNAKECLHIIHNEAESRRISASTAMNERSSRSHCLIRILVEKTITYADESDSDDSSDGEGHGGGAGARGGGAGSQKKIVSSMNLVDLAGSERVSKTGATGQRMVEGGHINKSLTILTTVINKLTEVNSAAADKSGRRVGGASSAAAIHVPYRDSKLTHLLKTALGGNSLTTVFCCVTQATEHTDESRSTLQFAARAKTIRNQVQMNEVADSRTRLREIELAYKAAKRQLVACTIYLWSKDLKLKLLREGGAVGGGGSASLGASPSRGAITAGGAGDLAASASLAAAAAGGGGAIVMDDGETIDAAQISQMQMLIEQLTGQNEKLQGQLSDAVRAHKMAVAAAAVAQQQAAATPSPSSQHVDPMALQRQREKEEKDEEEKAALLEEIEELQAMLEELENEGKESKESMLELEALVEELEEENEAKEKATNEANKRAKTLEIDLKSAQSQVAQQKKQMEQLQQQLKNNDVAALDKARGDELLSSLTKLHMDHQSLQFQHNELLDLYSRMEVEKAAQTELLREQVAELQLDRERESNAAKTINSYCWRLLNVAHLAAEGTPFEHDGGADGGKKGGGSSSSSSLSMIKESQVDTAVKALTAFVTSRAHAAPTVIESSQSAKALVGTVADDESSDAKGSKCGGKKGKGGDSGDEGGEGELKKQRSSFNIVCENEEEYKQKIRDLEKIITTKDAQRDIIVDTKLKRIQELVLRLQSTNLRLAEEVRTVVDENHSLFEIIKKEPRLAKSLNKTRFQPVSEDEIMLRALTATTIQRPLGHI